jgi:regulator of sirC expression with transglutaminase-like and TPR domain
MSSAQENQIKAMLALLSDPDRETADLVRQTLVSIGPDAVPSLLKAGEMADSKGREQLRTILDEIRLNHLEDRFHHWAESGGSEPDLEQGVFLLAEFRYPDLVVEPYQRRLDEMAQVLGRRLRGIAHPGSILERVSQFLFHEEGFHGNVQNYYDPDNSYLNRVLDRKTGIPISLSVIYLLLARRLGLPVSGVGLPGHFILKYESPDFSNYLDAFNQGQILTRGDCVRFLLNSGYEVREDYFASVSNLEIVLRMMRNLIYIYTQLEDHPRVKRLTRLIKILGGPTFNQEI